jgi:hypothetical protein
VYDSEEQLKKLYIQTCRRLPCYGCKVYQVKELLCGKTRKKVRVALAAWHQKNRLLTILQASRLLGLGAGNIVLLDTKTKILAKAQSAADLLQVFLSKSIICV